MAMNGKYTVHKLKLGIMGAVVSVAMTGLSACVSNDVNAEIASTGQLRLATPRLAPISEVNLTEEQILSMGADPLDPDLRVKMNLFKTMAHNTTLMNNWRGFGDYVNKSEVISDRDKELLIMRLAWVYYSEYEWAAHYGAAINAGLTNEQIEAVKIGPDAENWNKWDRAWLQSVDQLAKSTFITDKNWLVLTSRYTEPQLMEMFATVAHYHLVAMLSNSLGIQADEFRPARF